VKVSFTDKVNIGEVRELLPMFFSSLFEVKNFPPFLFLFSSMSRKVREKKKAHEVDNYTFVVSAIGKSGGEFRRWKGPDTVEVEVINER
jgi:hypothetical protein